MNRRTTVDANKAQYTSDGFCQGTPTPPRNGAPSIQYIQPRVVIPPSDSNCCPKSIRGMAWSKVGASLPAVKTTDHGLATLVQPAQVSTIASIHSIDGERIIDEQRELSKLSDRLCAAILQCSSLDVHNKALELQKQWLERHIDKNCVVIRKMFETEMENARRLLNDHSQQVPALQRKDNIAKESQASYDQQYQQFLCRRNEISKEIFDDERKIAQADAESKFLRRRLRNIEDESKFYLMKNQGLHERKAHLQCQLDEENFARQALQGEFRILEGEKVSSQDMRAATVDGARNGINISHVVGIPSAKQYTGQLKQEVYRMRDEYEKKIEAYREELHRKFELHLCRYKMQSIQPGSLIRREHEEQLEEHVQTRKEVHSKVNALRAKIDEIKQKIENVRRRVNCDGTGSSSRMERQQRLAMLNQSIRDRERQHEEALRARKMLKQKIASYQERLNHHTKYPTPCPPDERATFHGTGCASGSISAPPRDPPCRSSWVQGSQGFICLDDPPHPIPPPRSIPAASSSPYHGYSTTEASSHSQVVGSAWTQSVGGVEQDCRTLHHLLNGSPIDQIGVIRILCIRTVAQRLEIRDTYERLFNRVLAKDVERISNGSLSKFLRTLLFSSVEYDCFELRRTLQGSAIKKSVLIEILFSRSHEHIQAVRNNYRRLFKTTIEEDLRRDQDKRSTSLLISILQATRPEDNTINDDDINRDAQDLCETRADGSTFARLLSIRSNAQLKQVFTTYQRYSTVDIEQTVRMHIEGDLYCVLIAIIRLIRNRASYFAIALHKCLRGSATNEEDLNRIIVTRHEVDMARIKTEYLAIAKYTLYDHIQANVTGNYRRALLELVREDKQLDARETTVYSPNRPDATRRHRNGERMGVQWRDSVRHLPADDWNERPIMRSVSDRALNESRFNSSNQALIDSFNAGTSQPINARPMSVGPGQFTRLSRNTGNLSSVS